jgi:hypothetical protein
VGIKPLHLRAVMKMLQESDLRVLNRSFVGNAYISILEQVRFQGSVLA